MPTINQRLLLRLIIAAILLASGVFLLHYIQSDRSVEALRWQAENAANNGKLDKAILYTSQYLEFRPDDHEAAVNLGDMILQRSQSVKQLTNAMFIFEKVSRESTTREDVRRKLVDICLRLTRYGDALIHLQPLLQNHPDEAKLWEDQAVCQSALNRFDESRKSFETAIGNDPTRISSYALLAQLLIQQMNLHPEGTACIEKMVKANPKVAEAYLVRARYSRSENRNDDALRDVDYLLVLEPKNADGLLMYAELMQARGEIANARKALTTAIAEHPKDVRLHRALSWLELNVNNLPAAVACLDAGIRELPNETELLTPLADLLAQQGEVDKAEAIVKKLETRRAAPIEVNYLKARVLMQRGKYADALAIFEPLRTQAVGIATSSAQINLLMAACYQKMGDRAAQEETLQRVLNLDGSNLTARLQMGNVHLADGRLDEAINDYAIAVNAPTATLTARIMLGRLRIAQARMTHADAQAWSKIVKYADDLLEKHQQSAEPVLLMGEILAARNQYESAKKFLREACSKKLNDPRIWALRARVAQEMEGLYAALDVLDEAQILLGEAVELRLERARLWSADWQPGQSERIRALGQGIESLSESEQTRLLASLGEICSNIGDRAGVQHFYSEIASRLPKELPIRLALFELAARAGDESALNRLRGEIARLQPAESDLLAVAEALASDADTPATRALTQRILKASPDRADAHLLAARLAEKSGDLKTALHHHELAIEFDRGNLRNLQAELAFLLRTQQDAAATALIVRLYYDPRVSSLAYRSLIEVGAGKDAENIDRCLATLRPLLERDISQCLWAAQYARRSGKPKTAEEFLSLARGSAPKQIDVWVWTCRQETGPERLTELFDSARKSLDSRAYYRVAAEAESAIRTILPDWKPVQETPEDRREYAQACLNSLSIRGSRAQALDFLKEFVRQSTEQPGNTAWAMRNIAMLNATQGTPLQRREALAELRKAGAEPGSVEEMRSRVTGLAVAARQLTGAERRTTLNEAIKILKEIVASAEAKPGDWYHLGQFYHLAGQRAQYRECIAELMKREPGNLYYVVAYVDDLLDQGQVKDAESHIARLLEASHDLRAVSTVARFYCLDDRAAKSLEVLEQFYRSAEAGTSEGMARLRQITEILDRLARLSARKRLSTGYRTLADAAFEKYRASLRNYPEAVAPMAGLLAFDGKVAAAFDELNGMKGRLSAKILAAAGLNILSNGTGTPRQFQMVFGWIEAGLAEQPGSKALLMNLAGLHTLRQDFVAAAEAYQKLLDVDPDNIVALNNRAWILAGKVDTARDALKDVERAIVLSGPTGELLDTRARIRITLGFNDLALEDLNQALHQSQSGLLYFHLALVQSKLLRMDEARKTFKEAKNRGLDPRSIHPDDSKFYAAFSGGSGG